MTTPSANRIAATVVPCGTSATAAALAAVPAPSSPFGNWCGATRRNNSANDGPGSRGRGNSGNERSDIGGGAYPDALIRTGQRTYPLVHERGARFVVVPAADVVGGRLEQELRLLEQAE